METGSSRSAVKRCSHKRGQIRVQQLLSLFGENELYLWQICAFVEVSQPKEMSEDIFMPGGMGEKVVLL